MSGGSGPWLPVYTATLRHRKTIRLAALLGVDRQKAVGLLLDLWSWGLSNATPDGLIATCVEEELAIAVEWPRSASDLEAALQLAGWLTRQNGGIVLHEWELYGGRVQRSLAASRVRAATARSGKRLQPDDQCTDQASSGVPELGCAGGGSVSEVRTRTVRVPYAYRTVQEKTRQETTTGERVPRRAHSRRPAGLVREHPPTADEVQSYLDELGERRFTGAEFVDTNAAAGWVQGKARKPLVDWKAHARTWSRLRDEWGMEQPGASPGGSNVPPDEADGRAARNLAFCREIERYQADPLFAEYRRLVTAGTVPLGFETWREGRTS